MIQSLHDNHVQPGVIALAPFFLVASSFNAGLLISLIALALITVLCLILFNIKKLITHQQKLIMTLIVSATVLVIVRMLLNTEAYSLINSIGLIFPLIILNAWSLSVCETAFSIRNYKLLTSILITFGLTLIVFFGVYGLIRSLLVDFSVFTSPAGCFILAGFIFAVFNILKNKYS